MTTVQTALGQGLNYETRELAVIRKTLKKKTKTLRTVTLGNLHVTFLVSPCRVDDLIGRVTFDRDMLTNSGSGAKGLDKWFPLSPVYHSHHFSDIQGDIRIETTLFEKVKRTFRSLSYVFNPQTNRLHYYIMFCKFYNKVKTDSNSPRNS